MKYFLPALSLILASIPYSKAAEWTRESDQVTISAELIKFDSESGKAHLKLDNGKEVVIDQAVLIPENRERLAKHVAEDQREH